MATLFAATLHGQVFVGSDNFDNNTLTLQYENNLPQAAGQWRTAYVAAGTAQWTETGQRMEYTDSAGGTGEGALYWVTPSYSINTTPSGNNLGIGGTGLSSGAPYTSSWVARVQATNLVPTPTGVSYAGLETYTLYDPDGPGGTATSSNAFYGIYLTNDATYGSNLLVKWGVYNAGISDYDRTTLATIALTDLTDVTLRFSFDGTTHVLTADYSLDGINYLTGATMALAGAQAGVGAPYQNGMGLNLYAWNDQTAAITSGMITFDNYAVTAVPEPATVAVILGLGGLGLALWRRRRAT